MFEPAFSSMRVSSADITDTVCLNLRASTSWDSPTQYSQIHLKASRGLDLDDADKARINKIDQKGSSPLYWACFHNQFKTAEDLLEHGASVNLQNQDGETAMFIATRVGNVDLIRLLLKWGANPDFAEEKVGATAAHIAAEMGRIDILTVLRDAGASLDAQDWAHETPLHWATCKGQEEAIRFLVLHSAAIEMENEDSETPLQQAMDCGNEVAVECLRRSLNEKLSASR